MKRKLLIYSDCYIFGGSERLMASVKRNVVVNQHYDVVYSYRNHELYRDGMIEEFGTAANDEIIGIKLLSTDTLLYLNCIRKQSVVMRKFISLVLFVFRLSRIEILYNFFKLRALVKHVNPDVIHINNGGYPAALSCRTMVFAATCAGCKNISFQVNNMATPTPNRFMAWVDKLIDKRVKFFLTASIKARQTLADNRGFDLNKIAKIPNSVAKPNITKNREQICAEFQIPTNGFVICELGFIEWRKGQHLLIQAMEILREKRPEIYENTFIVMVGSGPLEQQTRDNLEQKKLNKHVILTGYRNDPSNFLAACDLFVLPSIANEDMPLVILEAMQMKKNIISTKFAGIVEEIENGVSGILFDANEQTLPENLYQAIVDIRTTTTNYGQAAYDRYLEMFSEVPYGKKYAELFNDILK